MPRLIITKRAASGVQRCRVFLHRHSPEVAERAGRIVEQSLFKLEASPLIGRPVEGRSHMRELVIPFGERSYVALYRYAAEADLVYILASWHQREAGY
ncbi:MULTISPECIES: type II toxin-antitoxin system RelE/ParE family toxin [unclassified Rhizobium]|uniref:type II toxin-antitoxin system RelE/ParE family toxin n=1 Tax=unclassified Rhizobium TaxID=2613769 RepID=UPI0009EA9B44|nr:MULTISPECIES: type II toxin-antitoxin system RelE/ParE family toxin [unclassified Rhizobium]